MLGIAPADFEMMTLAEFEAAEQGFMRRREYDFRTAMNIQRWGSFAIMASMCDMKGREMQEVLPLPWDREDGRRPASAERRISKREMAQMRESGNETPVIFLTAKDSVPDRVRGLDAGADDYLVKPFSFDELLARLRVVMRKRGGSATNVFTVADLTVDTASHHVTRGGRTIALSAKEFALLEYMIRNRGVVLSRERIENHLWNYDYSGGSNVVDVYMSYLRRKIDADYPTKLIHTVWGVGWVLREET